jgi:hypothetical protein
LFEPKNSQQVDILILHVVNGYTVDVEGDFSVAKVTILWPRQDNIPPESNSNAITATFGEVPYNGVVFGLYGCTSVIVVSRKGVWLSHFWDSPSFMEDKGVSFKHDVLDAMTYGDGSAEMPPLEPMTKEDGIFVRDAQPEAIIITPDEREYTIQIDHIMDELEELMPQIPITVHEYSRPGSRRAEPWNSPLGKVVLQYDPDCLGIHDGRQSCSDPSVLQLACAKVWMGGSPKPLLGTWWQYNNTFIDTDDDTNGTPSDPLGDPPSDDSDDDSDDEPGGVPLTRKYRKACSLRPSHTLSSLSFQPSQGTSAKNVQDLASSTTAIIQIASSTSIGSTTLVESTGLFSDQKSLASNVITPTSISSIQSTTLISVSSTSGLSDSSSVSPAHSLVLASLVSVSSSSTPEVPPQPSSSTSTIPPPPSPPSSSLSPPPPPYQTGLCNINLWELSDGTLTDSIYLQLNVSDGGNNLLYSKWFKDSWGFTATAQIADTNLPYDVAITLAESSKPKPHDTRDILEEKISAPPRPPDVELWMVQLRAGNTHWSSDQTDSSKRPYCNVGGMG